MGVSSIVTLGFSVSGGYQGGNNKIATVGYVAGAAAAVTAEFVCLGNASIATGEVSAAIAFGTSEVIVTIC